MQNKSKLIKENKLYSATSFCCVRPFGDNCLQVIDSTLFYCRCKDRRRTRELHSAHQGSVCELQQSVPWREEPGNIALVNDWWHLQDLWSLKVAAPLKSHWEEYKSCANSLLKAAGIDVGVIHLCLITPAAGRCHGRLLSAALYFTDQLWAADRSGARLQCGQCAELKL